MNKFESQKEAGRIAKLAHQAVAEQIKVGADLLDLEKVAASVIQKHGAKPAFKGFKGYPNVSCLSVNDEVVHAIPRPYTLRDGDVLSVDLGVTVNGWIVDTARTYIIGKNPQAQKLLDTAKYALEEAIKQAKPGNTTGDIGYIVEKIVNDAGFSVLEDLTGHGVGKTLQEKPSIPNHGQPKSGTTLEVGMTLAIEPIITTKPSQIGILSDGWTILTQTGEIAVHEEDTVYISKDGPVVLT